MPDVVVMNRGFRGIVPPNAGYFVDKIGNALYLFCGGFQMCLEQRKNIAETATTSAFYGFEKRSVRYE